MSLDRHVRALVERRAERLLGCAEFEHAEDSAKAVHDLRVAARRLRTYVALLAPWVGQKRTKRVGRGLRRVSRAVARLREWDVHAARVGGWLAAAQAEPERLVLEHIAEWVERQRRQTRRRALCRRDRIDFRRLAERLEQAGKRARRRLAKEPRARVSRALLEPSIDALFAALPPSGTQPDAERLHEARLRVRELRYALECVEPELGESYGPLRETVVGLQELLGEHHDRALLEALLRQRAASLAGRGRASLSRGIEALLEPLVAEQRALFARFERVRQDLDRAALVQQVRSALRGAVAGSTAVH